MKITSEVLITSTSDRSGSGAVAGGFVGDITQWLRQSSGGGVRLGVVGGWGRANDPTFLSVAACRASAVVGIGIVAALRHDVGAGSLGTNLTGGDFSPGLL